MFDDRLRLGSRLVERARPRRTREVVEAQPQRDGAADAGAARILRVTRSTSPSRTASTSAGERRRRPSAHCAPIERRRRLGCTRRGSRLCASACSWRPAASPTIETSALSDIAATSPTVVMPTWCSFAAVTSPTPQSRSTGSAMQEDEFALRRNDEETVGLRDRARDLREKLRPRDADGDRQADAPAHLAAQPRGDLGGAARKPLMPRTSRNASSIERPSTKRRHVVEDAVHRLARLAVRRHAGRDDDGARAQPAREAAAHRRPDAEGLRLVARGEHDPGADDDGPAAQGRVVPLFDRGVERVDVRVEDRRAPARTYVRTGTQLRDESEAGRPPCRRSSAPPGGRCPPGRAPRQAPPPPPHGSPRRGP